MDSVLQLLPFSFPILSNYSTALFSGIKSCFDPAVTSIFSTFSLSLKTDTVPQCSWPYFPLVFCIAAFFLRFHACRACLFAILFPCIRTSRDYTVASIFFFCSLSRRTDTVPQDRYQIVVPFVSHFCKCSLRGLLSEWAFRFTAYISDSVFVLNTLLPGCSNKSFVPRNGICPALAVSG